MKRFLFACIIFSGMSCSFNSTSLNSDADKTAADKIAVTFYEAVRENALEKTYPVLSKDFFLYTTKPEYEIMMGNFNRITGNLMNYELEKWDSKVVSGTDPSGSYHLQYKVYYDKDTTTETFNLIKEEDGIKIIGYQINSKKLTGTGQQESQ